MFCHTNHIDILFLVVMSHRKGSTSAFSARGIRLSFGKCSTGGDNVSYRGGGENRGITISISLSSGVLERSGIILSTGASGIGGVSYVTFKLLFFPRFHQIARERVFSMDDLVVRF